MSGAVTPNLVADVLAGAHWAESPQLAMVVVRSDGTELARYGAMEHRFRLASISKPLFAWAALQLVEDGSVTLDDEVPTNAGRVATLRQLLSHCAGLAFDLLEHVARPGTLRTYSNAGYLLAAQYLERRTGLPPDELLAEGLFQPLGMTTAALEGHPGADVWCSAEDLGRFVREVWSPTLLDHSTVSDMLAEQCPGIPGIVPGIGRYRPNPWGIGFELRGDKTQHWTGTLNSPKTFGHFGGSGTFVWWDPIAELSLVALGERGFGEWALEAWPRLTDDVLRAASRAPQVLQ